MPFGYTWLAEEEGWFLFIFGVSMLPLFWLRKEEFMVNI